MGATHLDPIPALVQRSQEWKTIVTDLDQYFLRAAQHYDGLIDSSESVSESIKDQQEIPSTFDVSGSSGIRDVFAQLKSIHKAQCMTAHNAVKVITNTIRPQLAELNAALDKSIKDFKSWQNKFNSPLDVNAELHHLDPQLSDQIKEYERAVASAEAHEPYKHDPLVLKLALDKEIDHLVAKLNSQAESLAYVQGAAKEVDRSVVETLQSQIKLFSGLLGDFSTVNGTAQTELAKGFPKISPNHEYKHWVECQAGPVVFASGNDVKFTARTTDTEFRYPKQDSLYAQIVKAGPLERRARVIRSYSSGDYVLTPQNLIELNGKKPGWSASLIGASLVDDDKYPKDQFVLRAAQTGSLTGKTHKFVFKSPEAHAWKHDIQKILSGDILLNIETSMSNVDVNLDKDEKLEQNKGTNSLENPREEKKVRTSLTNVRHDTENEGEGIYHNDDYDLGNGGNHTTNENSNENTHNNDKLNSHPSTVTIDSGIVGNDEFYSVSESESDISDVDAENNAKAVGTLELPDDPQIKQ